MDLAVAQLLLFLLPGVLAYSPSSSLRSAASRHRDYPFESLVTILTFATVCQGIYAAGGALLSCLSTNGKSPASAAGSALTGTSIATVAFSPDVVFDTHLLGLLGISLLVGWFYALLIKWGTIDFVLNFLTWSKSTRYVSVWQAFANIYFPPERFDRFGVKDAGNVPYYARVMFDNGDWVDGSICRMDRDSNSDSMLMLGNVKLFERARVESSGSLRIMHRLLLDTRTTAISFIAIYEGEEDDRQEQAEQEGESTPSIKACPQSDA